MQYKQPGMQAMQTLQARKDAGTIKPAGMARLQSLRQMHQDSPMVRRGPQGTAMGEFVANPMQGAVSGPQQGPFDPAMGGPRVSDGLVPQPGMFDPLKPQQKLTRPMPMNPPHTMQRSLELRDPAASYAGYGGGAPSAPRVSTGLTRAPNPVAMGPQAPRVSDGLQYQNSPFQALLRRR